jgi:hypothetical protein
MPCIDRRAAMIEWGLDDSSQFAFDSFQDLGDMKPHQRADFRGLIQFAERAIAASPMELETTVLSHGCFSPEVGGRIGPYAMTDYSPWADMIQFWARDFRSKMHTRVQSQRERWLDSLRRRSCQVPTTLISRSDGCLENRWKSASVTLQRFKIRLFSFG